MTTSLVSSDSRPYIWMDRQDDDAIVAELKGVKSTALVYEFVQEGKPVRGLSKQGVDECTRTLARRGEVLRSLDTKWLLNGEYYEVICTAGRFAVAPDGRELTMDTVTRAKRQWLYMRHRDGTITEDPFAFEKAITKAERNAKAALIPVDVHEAMIAEAVRKGLVHRGDDAEMTRQEATKASHDGPPKEWPCITSRCKQMLRLINGKNGLFYGHKAGTGWHNAKVENIEALAAQEAQAAQEAPESSRPAQAEAEGAPEDTEGAEVVSAEADAATPRRHFDTVSGFWDAIDKAGWTRSWVSGRLGGPLGGWLMASKPPRTWDDAWSFLQHMAQTEGA